MLEVRDLLDSTLGYITEYSDLAVELQLDSWPEISFNVPVTSLHRQLLQNELGIIYAGEPFVIKSCDPSRDNDGGPRLTVKAPSIAAELNKKPRQIVGTYVGSDIYANWSPNTSYKKFDRIRYYGVVYECTEAHTSGMQLAGTQWQYWTTCNFQAELVEAVLTLTDIMTVALRDTGWSVGKVDDDGSARTFSGEWVQVPALLQEIATKFDRHIVYHGSTKTIDAVITPGKTNLNTLEYGKNLTGITKSSDSTDFVTKLFVYGDENLVFNEVNIHDSSEHPLYQIQNNQSFILNFDYFLAQGYTLDQIYQSWLNHGDSSPFFHIDKLDMSDYIEPAVMLADAKKKMAQEKAFPQVTYSVDFVNLAEVLDNYDENIGLGDTITVRDTELGIEIPVTVVSLKLTPGYPEKSSATLSNKDDFFGDVVANSISSSKKVSGNAAIQNLLNRSINTATTAINSSTGDLSWANGQITAVELDANSNPTGKQIRVSPAGLGVSTDFGVTYANAITGDGVLASTVLADSLHILSVGADGIVIEPQTSGVRLNNTEGIIVQSADKRFKAQLKASDEMGGTSRGFSLWNGTFTDVTISHTTDANPVFTVNGTSTTIGYVADYYYKVGKTGNWYIFCKTDTPSTGTITLTGDQDAAVYNGYWYLGYDTQVAAEYTGDSLVFGVNMNGDGYFKGEVHATSGRFDGEVHASSGDFTGAIHASDFYVGQVDILDFIQTYIQDQKDYLKIGNITLNGSTGAISTTGNLDLGGNINISGNIVWNGQSPMKLIYINSTTAPATPTADFSAYPASGTTAWHQSNNSTDTYMSISSNGGAAGTWGVPVKIAGKDGMNGTPGSDASVTAQNVFNALTSNGTMYGCFSAGYNTLYINANYISTGTLNCDNITIQSENSYGGLMAGYGMQNHVGTAGAMLYGGSAGDGGCCTATNAGVSLKAGGPVFYVSGALVHSDQEIDIGSDIRLKNTIQYDIDKYEDFFRALKPVSYKLNSDIRNKRHTGFIAQDVKQALADTGIPENDFAGLTQHTLEDWEVGEVRDPYSLGYSEFTSLNTHMIQKLLDRVDTLESEVTALQQK